MVSSLSSDQTVPWHSSHNPNAISFITPYSTKYNKKIEIWKVPKPLESDLVLDVLRKPWLQTPATPTSIRLDQTINTNSSLNVLSIIDTISLQNYSF